MKLAAIALSVLLTLLVVELALRLLWTPPSWRSHSLFRPHDVYGWAPRPGITGTHATPEYCHQASNTRQGFRGSEVFSAERPADVRARILFIGDSFTYGLGAENSQTFVELVNAAFPDVEVINSGANGYCTRECAAVLDHLGPALRPDLTVYVFYWNDIEDNLRRTTPDFAVDNKGRSRRLDRESPGGDPLALLPPDKLVPVGSGGKLYTYWLFHEGLRGLRYRTLGISRRWIRNEQQKAEAWTKTEVLLEAMHARASEIGTELVIVSLPDHNQVNPDAVIRNISSLNYDVQDTLRDLCARLHLTYVDLLPGLQERWRASGEDFYHYADRHLTPSGNQAAAAQLIDSLRPLIPTKRLSRNRNATGPPSASGPSHNQTP